MRCAPLSLSPLLLYYPPALTSITKTPTLHPADGVERVVGQVWGAEHQGLQMEHHPGPSRLTFFNSFLGRVGRIMYGCTYMPPRPSLIAVTFKEKESKSTRVWGAGAAAKPSDHTAHHKPTNQ
jgi:hypothetical protein